MTPRVPSNTGGSPGSSTTRARHTRRDAQGPSASGEPVEGENGQHVNQDTPTALTTTVPVANGATVPSTTTAPVTADAQHPSVPTAPAAKTTKRATRNSAAKASTTSSAKSRKGKDKNKDKEDDGVEPGAATDGENNGEDENGGAKRGRRDGAAQEGDEDLPAQRQTSKKPRLEFNTPSVMNAIEDWTSGKGVLGGVTNAQAGSLSAAMHVKIASDKLKFDKSTLPLQVSSIETRLLGVEANLLLTRAVTGIYEEFPGRDEVLQRLAALEARAEGLGGRLKEMTPFTEAQDTLADPSTAVQP